MQALDANFVRRHPGPLDALVFGSHQIDGNPTLDVSSRRGVGFPPLCGEAADYPFLGSRRLHNQSSIYGGNKGREVLALLEACLQVHHIICLLLLLKTFFWCLRQMGLGVYVHDVHVVNTVSIILLEVTDKEATFLFRVL